ncbi:MAG: hypothetical protein WBG48_01600 [Pricia sp.]
MLKIHGKLFLVPLVVLTNLDISYAQSEHKPLYQWFDQQMGTANKGIYNGYNYTEKYRTINKKHKFFRSETFLPGMVHFEGQPYYDLELKYDLYEDNLLLNSKSAPGTTIALKSSQINHFFITGQEFVRLTENNTKGLEATGFYQVLLETDILKLFKKNSKNIVKKVRKELVYYEFKDDNEYLLFYDGKYYPANRRKDLLRLFPKAKQDIGSYFKNRGRTSPSDTQLVALIQKIASRAVTKPSN